MQKKFTTMKHLKLSILFLAVVLLNFSCEEEKASPDQNPAVPPASTMEIDFENFSTAPEGKRVAASYRNAITANINVSVWNTILGAHLIIPVAALKYAGQQTPVFDEENSQWTWSYEFEADGATHSAMLTAGFSTDGIQWNMYISKSEAYQNVLWFTGTSNITGTEGNWKINYLPENPTPFIEIDWSRESDNTAAEIKYTNVIPEDEYNGSYVEYGIDKSLALDVFYNVYLSKDDVSVEIQLNSQTNEGRIKSVHNLGEGFHCWNSAWEDVECAE